MKLLDSGRITAPSRVTGLAAALTGAVMAGTAGYLVGRYPQLTPYLPVHFGGTIIADRWQQKSWALVLLPLWVQLSLALAFGSMAVILLWRTAPARHATHGDEASDRRRMLAAAEAVALFALIWIAFQALAAVQLVQLWQRGWGGLGEAYAFGLGTAVLASTVVGIRAMAEIGRAPAPHAPDSAVWRLKVLYVNPEDPALFVPARRGAGWTLNFGRPAAVTLMALVVLLGIGAPVAIITLVTRRN
ncbi:MAG: hypothetical protein HYX76_12745 [Acidobacteria bacterium]|nr:hypothetical protein [Acidobacteriota bacterium]